MLSPFCPFVSYHNKGFPNVDFGHVLQHCLALKMKGLDSVMKPFKYAPFLRY
ncbi:DUF3820 family protein [Vibrio sp. D401a]|nr:DUF3820 family protein [Vibrio sp. D401a]MDK9801295.1 DUF3820 family protein [Vibrio sp. D406a]